MSDTQSAPFGVGGSGFVRRLIDHPTIPDELRGDVARMLDDLGIANAYIDELEARLATLEAENKALRDRFSDADTERNGANLALKTAFSRIMQLEEREKQAREDESWAKQNLAYVSMSEDGCWAGIYDRDASEERGLVERVDTIADALSALRDMVEGGAR